MNLAVGMIGLAHPHSAAHLRTLETSAMVQRIVLCDPDPGAREQGSRACGKVDAAYADLPALLARADVPVVVIALPTDLTPAAVVQAAEAGKHIICEKPCARTAAEMRPIVEMLERRRGRFAACYVWRAHPAIERMRGLVQGGALGRLTSAELRMVTSQVRLRDPAHWLFKRTIAGGGVLSWLGCHWLDVLRYVTGQEVTQVGAMLATLSGEAIDVEDVAGAGLRLTGGAVATLYAGYLLPYGRAGYEGASFDLSVIFRGTDAALEYQNAGGDQLVTLRGAASGREAASEQRWRFALPAVPAYGGAHGLTFVETFIRSALSGEGASPASALDALRVLEILDAVYASAATGRTVDLAGRSA
jgi:predicted dehydrogenase